MQEALIQRHQQGFLDDGNAIDASTAASRVLAGELERDEFACRDECCGVVVHLCSFQAHNLKDPYFAANTGDGHKPGCSEISGVGGGSGGVVDDADISVFIDEDPEDAARQRSGQGRLPFAGRSTSQLKRLVRAYAAQPDKSGRPLRIAGVRGETYRECFFPLDGAATVQCGDRRVYYGTVRFTAGRAESEDGIALRMLRPERKDEPRHVIIDSCEWAPAKRAALNESLTYLVRETRSVWLANSSSPRALFLFVLAAPEAGNRFRIDSPRHYFAGDSNDLPGLLRLPKVPCPTPAWRARQRSTASTISAPTFPPVPSQAPEAVTDCISVQPLVQQESGTAPKQSILRILGASVARLVRWLHRHILDA